MAGGKGVNIARTLKALGQPVIATGFAGGATGTHIVEQLTEESILNDFVRIREESRTNTSVLDPTTGEQTEINERGPAVSEREVELFRDKLLYLARGAAIVVFAGSLPRGVEPDLYAALIRDLERLEVTTVIDTDGEPLRQAVRAEPDVVSPNVLEAEELVGHEFSGEEERSQVVREIVALGPREAIMTLPDGCIAQVLVDGQPALQTRAHRAARADRQARLRRRLPGRLRRGALRGAPARPVPALRRRLRRRVDRSPGSRADRPARGAPADGRRRAVLGRAARAGQLSAAAGRRRRPGERQTLSARPPRSGGCQLSNLGQADAVAGRVAEAGVDPVRALLGRFGELDAAAA